MPENIIEILQLRFKKFSKRHPDLLWEEVEARLKSSPDKLEVLAAMEQSGGEPDVVRKEPTGEFLFVDCSEESPKGRRSSCYDEIARDERKENRPDHSALGLAKGMGVTLLDEQEYRFLQTLGNFDQKTSSWVLTPIAIRSRGGAIFSDRRYDHVFTYHNGAESYYGSRGFRAKLLV